MVLNAVLRISWLGDRASGKVGTQGQVPPLRHGKAWQQARTNPALQRTP